MLRSFGLVSLAVAGAAVLLCAASVAGAQQRAAYQMELPPGSILYHAWKDSRTLSVLMVDGPVHDGTLHAASYNISLKSRQAKLVGHFTFEWKEILESALVTVMSRDGKYLLSQGPSPTLPYGRGNIVTDAGDHPLTHTRIGYSPIGDHVGWLADSRHWIEWIGNAGKVVIRDARGISKDKDIPLPRLGEQYNINGESNHLQGISAMSAGGRGVFWSYRRYAEEGPGVFDGYFVVDLTHAAGRILSHFEIPLDTHYLNVRPNKAATRLLVTGFSRGKRLRSLCPDEEYGNDPDFAKLGVPPDENAADPIFTNLAIYEVASNSVNVIGCIPHLASRDKIDWSPDEKHASFACNGKLWIVDLPL